jgi:hypothetical protein
MILQFKYTAREGGKAMSDLALAEVQNNIKNGNRLFSLKHEFPDEWHKFLNTPAPNNDQVLQLDLKPSRFPYLISNSKFDITNVALFVDSGLASIPELSLTSPGLINISFLSYLLNTGLYLSDILPLSGEEDAGTWKLINPLGNAIKLNSNNCNDMIAIVSYQQTV